QGLGVLAGLSVMLAVVGYVLHVQRATLDARLRVFVGGAALPPQALVAVSRPAHRMRWLSFARGLRLGARPSQLAQAGVSVTPRRFLTLQIASAAAGLAPGAAVGRAVPVGGGALPGAPC